ncbi:MAG TPA: hypothetical protein PKA00_01995 [Saprospiraceae bacterium]|nr:hypothetical protein [Saprospiraceae bacterium]HMQ81643.1 hypothetical protein [Saprospiraceae bacterium]
MNYLSPFFFGLFVTAFGTFLPGLVNMTAVKVSLSRSFKAGMRYAFGAGLTIFFQAYIAVTFAEQLGANPQIILWLKRVAVFVFLALSGIFLYQGLFLKVPKVKTGRGLPILLGMFTASMNVLNIPYCFAAGLLLQSRGHISLELPYRLYFVSGAMTGAFLMLAAYARFAQAIASHAQFFTRNLNYFLSGLFLVLAGIQLFQLYYPS